MYSTLEFADVASRSYILFDLHGNPNTGLTDKETHSGLPWQPSG